MTDPVDTLGLKTMGNKINRGISFIIYADAGVGKTTLAATLPPETTLIVNTEAGLGPLLGTGLHVYNVVEKVHEHGKDIEKVMADLILILRTSEHPFENVVIDNLTELEQLLVSSLTNKRNKEVPELREYGECSFKMKEWLHNLRDLVFSNINVVFNAWEFPMDIRNQDGQVLTKTFPMMGKKIAPQACGIVDCVGHLEVYPKSGKRWVRFGPHEQYITKTQFQGLDAGEYPDFPTILDKLRAYDYKKDDQSGSETDKKKEK